MKKVVLLTFVSLLLLMMTVIWPSDVLAWSNGGYSDDPSNPDYGTHDWIAEHALDWLPEREKRYIVDNLAPYLYGTELPDNGVAPDGIGDKTKHHIYYWSNGSLQEDASAVRASEEYNNTLNFLRLGDLANASKTAGIMSHYIVDVAVFGHVMGASTDWGVEEHHSDYETYVNQRTSSYDAEFNVYLSFDGELNLISAYDAARELAYDTTFDLNGDLTCVWMDQNYDWSDPAFKDKCGESLNLAVNYLTDVLHTFYSEAASVHNIHTDLDYLTIQEAIDAPETLDGHTILVGTGTYCEHVVLDKSVSLIGENRTGTVIDGNGTGTLMWITANSVTISGFTFCNSGHDYGDCGILIENSQGNNVANNIITNNLYGIGLVNSTNISLTDNVACENAVAVYLCNSSCNEITRNNIDFANNSCIALWQDSDNNIIRYNSISHSNCTGIYTNNSDNNTIVFNNMSFNEGGIYLRESNYNILIGNNIITSILTGLALRNITDSKIYSNTIAHNPYGIYSANISNNIFADNTIADNEYCVLLKHSYDNVFYHNNFIDTYFQVWSVNRNSWDNDLEGNYWNDYEGKDPDNDGIGDTPYFIDVNNKDNYPLMGSFSDFNVTSEYLFQTVCNSSISDFQFNGTAIRLNVSSENGTTGFCRICIPTALMNATYKVFVNGIEVPHTLLPCSNSTHSYLYFTYNHSTQEVIIIQEFPKWSSIFLVLIILTFAIVICKRRLPKTLRLFCCS